MDPENGSLWEMIPPRTGSRKWPASWKDTPANRQPDVAASWEDPPANRQPEVAICPLLARRKMAQRKKLEPVQLPLLGLPEMAPRRGPFWGPDVAASWADPPANRQPEVAICPLRARRKMAQRKKLEPAQLPPLGLPERAPRRGPFWSPDVAASWKDTPANRQPEVASFLEGYPREQAAGSGHLATSCETENGAEKKA